MVEKKGVCGRSDYDFLVGSHTLRKTAYLFAIWGYFEGKKLGHYEQYNNAIVGKNTFHAISFDFF